MATTHARIFRFTQPPHGKTARKKLFLKRTDMILSLLHKIQILSRLLSRIYPHVFVNSKG